MNDVKWIKLTTDMFDNRKIKHLRKLPDGNNCVLIWVMLLTLAGRCNANGMIFLTETFPYSPKMLADELDFEENTVKMALVSFEALGMIERVDDFIKISGWDEYQSVDKLSAIREYNRLAKQKQRAKQKQLTHVKDMSLTCQTIEKEIEKEIEKDIKTQDCTHSAENEQTLEEKFAVFWAAYPKHKGKQDAVKAFNKLNPTEALLKDILKAVEAQKSTRTWQKDNGEFIPYPATWLRGRRWEDEEGGEQIDAFSKLRAMATEGQV